jgi:hypothetical protein
MMALLEVHDTVDITDFSQVTWLGRVMKENRKQEWAEIEFDFVSAGPRPEKEDCSTHGLNSKSQQGRLTSLGSGTARSLHQQATDVESDFSSDKQDVHTECDAGSARFDDGGFGYDMDASATGSKRGVKEVKEPKWGMPSGKSAKKEKAKARKTKTDEVKERDDGGFTLRSTDKEADLEKTKVDSELREVPEWDQGCFAHDPTWIPSWGTVKAEKTKAAKAKVKKAKAKSAQAEEANEAPERLLWDDSDEV